MVTAESDDVHEETCKLVVQTSNIRTTASIMAVASLCTAAALYYRKRRRSMAKIDLAKEENLVQTDFVELAQTGVSV